MKMSLLRSTSVRHFLSDCVDNDLVLDEDNCIECDEVQSGLEKIDDETDALDITFVKVNDPRYAKKYGVSKLPALVYFRRKFPSIYRGTVPSTGVNLAYNLLYSDSLFDEDKILEWLTSNRYKQLELGVFMYAIVSLAITFMCYTGPSSSH